MCVKFLDCTQLEVTSMHDLFGIYGHQMALCAMHGQQEINILTHNKESQPMFHDMATCFVKLIAHRCANLSNQCNISLHLLSRWMA